ncbi:methyltransferase, TIGR04325 family [Ferrovibrio sp.]|uniref:methyltransferase, TIGR04325 family n=1 Tax=Ferrovibrio sp. TaxID=1917215 RepID=UPI000CBE0193|nr:methyltransferase, TIGR04325 family [Ferrovibrio sp.]PJI41912.1 MAG: hypothetical protein CTR53_05505 [Ferrovibrio sp.]
MVMSVWNGVFETFAAARGDSTVFHGDIWVQKLLDRAERDVAGLQGGALPDTAAMRDYPTLPIAALLGMKRKPINILDYGGGMGTGYFQLKAALPEFSGSYHVVEMAAVCEVARKRLAGFGNLHFYEEMPSALPALDIAQIASALHYVEDWRALLKQIASLRAGIFILADLLAGDIPTFVTTQNFYGARIPVWLWNVKDICKEMQQCGYKPILMTKHLTSVRGKDGPLPMSDLPESHRLDHSCNIVFALEG